ncbi:MAG: fused MFS/spermidine synthase [Pigmentiphaga sp.]|nr:fused MFS/spermidine synthase [Pigmentiphaga sp.]
MHHRPPLHRARRHRIAALRQNGAITPKARYAVLALGLVLLISLLIFYRPVSTESTRLLHREPSQFGSVLVFEEHGQRCLDFNAIQDGGRQTCFDLAAPDHMVFTYTRMMTSALFVNPDPANILIIGLGGATLQNALQKILPRATIDSVEVDPAVARMSERYFGYKPGPRQRVFIEDGRAFVERARQNGQHYDMVMLDAFDVDYIPPHLQTREFLEQVRALLSPSGVLVANTFTRRLGYDRESATYAAVFGDFFNLRSGNRVIIASRENLPDHDTLSRNANGLASTLSRFGIDVERELQRFSTIRDWDEGVAVLTD